MNRRPTYGQKNSVSFKKLFTIMTFILLASCGAKKNTVSTNGNGNGNISLLNNGGPIGDRAPYTQTPNFDGNQASQINNIIGSFQCKYGPRTQQILTFNTQYGQNNGRYTTILPQNGLFNDGALNGNVSQIYVGISVYNDVMVVSKITDGGANVLGYNVTLSLCSYSNLVMDGRPLSRFRSNSQGIKIDEDTKCGFGTVDSAQNTILMSDRHTYTAPNGINTTLAERPVLTTYFKPQCN